MDAVTALARTELFQDLAPEVLERIASLTRTASYEEGDAVYALGDDAEDLFLLSEGRLRFSLGVGNRLHAAQTFEVRRRSIGDQGHLRPGPVFYSARGYPPMLSASKTTPTTAEIPST